MLIGFAMMTMGVAAFVTLGATLPMSFGSSMDFGQLALLHKGEEGDITQRA